MSMAGQHDRRWRAAARAMSADASRSDRDQRLRSSIALILAAIARHCFTALTSTAASARRSAVEAACLPWTSSMCCPARRASHSSSKLELRAVGRAFRCLGILEPSTLAWRYGRRRTLRARRAPWRCDFRRRENSTGRSRRSSGRVAARYAHPPMRRERAPPLLWRQALSLSRWPPSGRCQRSNICRGALDCPQGHRCAFRAGRGTRRQVPYRERTWRRHVRGQLTSCSPIRCPRSRGRGAPIPIPPDGRASAKTDAGHFG